MAVILTGKGKCPFLFNTLKKQTAILNASQLDIWHKAQMFKNVVSAKEFYLKQLL